MLSKFKNHLLLALFFSAMAVTASAQNFTLTSNGDTHASVPTSSALDGGGQVTLRSALEAATQILGTHIITIPGFITTINLSLGQITVGSSTVGNNITVNGPGKAVLTINQTTAARVFITGVGAITFSLNDLTLNYNGPTGSIGGGGGAIQAGGTNANTTLTNVAINNFNIQSGNGGAVLCSTANTNNFTATNCDFNNNRAGGGGGAISIVSNSVANLTNCKFTNNTTGTVGASVGGSGGALLTSGTGNGGTYTVNNCTFTNNQTTNPTPQTGGAAFNTNGQLIFNFCRFTGNTITGGGAGETLGQAGGATIQNITANNNWWGQNSGPSATDLVVLAAGGTITATKWLQLKTSASLGAVCTGANSTVTASFLSNSAAEAVTTGNVSTLIGLPISFNSTFGTLSSVQATIQNNGTATAVFTGGLSAGTGTVNAVVDNIPGNDVAPARVNITVNTAPVVNSNPSNTSVISGSNANFTASFTGTPVPTVQWQVSTNGGGLYADIAGQTTTTLNFTTTGSQNGNLYRLRGTNTCGTNVATTGALLTVTGGCSTAAVISVTGSSSICAGSSTTIAVSITGGVSPYTLVYNDGTSNFSVPGYTSGTNISVSPASTRSYTIVSVTDVNSCVGSGNSGTASVTVNPAISAGINNNSGTTILNCTQTSISVTATGGTTYLWDGGATPNTAANTFTSPGTYHVTVTGAGGCNAPAQITITQNITPPTAGITNNSGTTLLTCTQTSISVTATGGVSYSWNGGATPGTANNSFSSPGTYTVTVTGANGCTSQAQIIITQNSTPPTAGITNNTGTTQLDCTITSISVTATGGVSYSWNGGATPGTANNSFSSPGTYTVTVTGANGCTSQAQIVLTQSVTPPTAGITNNSGSTVLTCALTSISVTATGGVSYSWDGGATPGTANNSFNSPGTYTVTVTAAGGCTAQAQIVITQNTTPPTAGITNNTGTTQLDCTITSISVTATGGVSYSWNGGATPGTANNSFSSPGTFTVTVTGANGCTSQAQIVITQSVTPPTAGITNNSGTTVLTCSQTAISVTATGGVSYSWDGGATPGTANNSFSSAGTYTVTVTAAGGCTAQAQIVITQNTTPPTAGITNNSGTTQLGCGVTAISVTATGGVSYSWDGGATPGTANNSFTSPGTYTVTVTGTNGCTSQAQIVITTNPGIPPTPGPFTGPVNVCRFIGTGELLTYTTPPVAGATFAWTVPSTVTIVSGQGTNSLTITLNPGFLAGGNKQLRVITTSVCGTSPLGICYLLAQAPNTPQPIVATGTNACPIIGTANTYTYTIRSVIGATYYQWQAQAGTTVIGHPNGTGINDTTITVSFLNGFSNSNITVQAGTDSCGLSGSRSIAVMANAPSAPSLITGPTNACEFIAPNGVPASYSVVNDPANTYNWTLPPGATGVTGQGTSSISFTYPAGYTSGSISVTASNGCGTGLPRSLNITRLTPSALSGIDVIQTAPCPNRVFTYSVSAIPANATSVQWAVPTASGAVLVSGQGTTSITVSYLVNAVNAVVTATAVSNCGISSARSTPVRLPACEPGPPGGPFAKGNTASKTTTATTTETMHVSLFPNPTVSDFKLKVVTAGKEKINVRITDMQGRELKQLNVMPTQTITVGSDLKAGSYMVEVRQGAVVKTTKLIKM